MPIRVQVHDKVVEFPDGTTEDVMRKALSTLSSDVPTPSAADMATHKVGRDNGNEIKGLTKTAFDIAGGMAHPGINTETGQSKSKLETAGDFVGLLLPSTLGMEGRSILDAGSRYYQGTKAALRDTHSIRDAATLPVRAYQKVKDALPSSNAAAVEEFLGPKSTYTLKPVTVNSAADIVDRNMPAVKPAPAVPKPPVAKAPTLEEALTNIVQEIATEKDPILNTTAGPAVETAGGGSFKQSWTKSKKQNLGGYSSGRPPESPTYEPGITATEGVKPPPATLDSEAQAIRDQTTHVSEAAPTTVEGKGAGSVGTDNADVTVTEPNMRTQGEEAYLEGQREGKRRLSVADTAAELRRHYGSRDAGTMLYGNSMSAAERAEAVKRLAPGPSRTPIVAENRINAAPRDLSLEEALREIIINRGGKPE